MNKFKQLTKRTVKQGVIAAIIVATVGGVFGGVSYYADTIAKAKSDAESKLSSDKGTLSNLKTQMDKSGEAEKRFAAIQQEHQSTEFYSNLDGIKGCLSASRGRYHLGTDTKFEKGTEAPSDRSELSSLNYNILVRSRMKLTFSALTDMHVFSFLQDLKTTCPGLIRVDSLKLSRKGELDDLTISQIRNGTTPLLVSAEVQLSWIGIMKKESKDPKSATPPTPPAP